MNTMDLVTSKNCRLEIPELSCRGLHFRCCYNYPRRLYISLAYAHDMSESILQTRVTSYKCVGENSNKPEVKLKYDARIMLIQLVSLYTSLYMTSIHKFFFQKIVGITSYLKKYLYVSKKFLFRITNPIYIAKENIL